MKKVFFLPALMLALGYQAMAMKSVDADSLDHIQLEEVVVSGTRAGQQTPVSYSNISSSDIQKQNAARNIPAILQISVCLRRRHW